MSLSFMIISFSPSISIFGALAHGEDFAALRFLLGGVGDDDAAGGLLFSLGGTHEDSVC